MNSVQDGFLNHLWGRDFASVSLSAFVVLVLATFLLPFRRQKHSEGANGRCAVPVVTECYHLPFLGSFLAFRRDPLGFISSWSSKLNSGIVQVYMLGETWIFVVDPFAAESIIGGRYPHLTWRESKFRILRNGGGMFVDDEDARCVSENRISHAVIDKYLLKDYDQLIQKYQASLNDSVLAALMEKQQGGGSEPTAEWDTHGILDIFGGAIWCSTMLSLYGFEEPATKEVFLLALKFYGKMEKLIQTRSPTIQKYLCEEEFEARDELVLKIKEAYDRGASDYITELSSLHGQNFKNPENVFRYIFINVMAATTLNTVPTAFWVVYYLLANERAYGAVVKEVFTIYNDSNAKGDGNQAKVSFSSQDLNRMTNLDSLITETLRLRTTSRTFRSRFVSEDCDLKLKIDGKTKNIRVKRGENVMTCPSLFHRDEEVFKDAGTFKWDRFVPDEEGNSPIFSKGGKTLLRPVEAFGGGSTICPGRKFARGEIKAIVANMLLRYEMRFIGSDAPTPPEVQGELTSSGMPKSDVLFEARRREFAR